MFAMSHVISQLLIYLLKYSHLIKDRTSMGASTMVILKSWSSSKSFIQSNCTFTALNLHLMTDSKVLHHCRVQSRCPLTTCVIAVGGNRPHSTYTSYGILVEPTNTYRYDISVNFSTLLVRDFKETFSTFL